MSISKAGSDHLSDRQWFRYVMGQCPTAVTVITSVDPDGNPIGMVVGTFLSVSLDPPLVGFLPDHASTTWPLISRNGRFCANVLAADHEPVARAMFAKDPERFSRYQWDATASGLPRLRNPGAWVDCTVESVVPAGDHDIVIGRVESMGLGEPASAPLLFLRGTYGYPKVPSLDAEEAGLAALLGYAEASTGEVHRLAEELELGCRISAAVEGTVTVLRSISPTDNVRDRIGTFPLVAPVAPLFVAWSSPADVHRWLQRAGDLQALIFPDRPEMRFDPHSADELLARTRELGYSVSTGVGVSDLVHRAVVQGSGPSKRVAVAEAINLLHRHTGAQLSVGGLDTAREVTDIHVPVFDHRGSVALVLTLTGFGPHASTTELRRLLAELAASARRCTEAIGGIPQFVQR